MNTKEIPGHNVRVQFDMTPEAVRNLEELMSATNAGTKKEIINNALTLFEWAIKQYQQGRVIASLDEKSGKYRKLEMPPLERVTLKE